jgi:outer membrane receptor protein involved in Fe transport
LFGAQNQLPIIRGAAQTFGALNVGVFLDGVYLSGKAAVDIELNDLERIEVVKGPQSALYGRNTFAGAINYITRAPASEPEVNGEVTVGDHGLIKLRASASGPITDKLGVRVGAYYREHNGFYTSAIDDGRVDAGQNYGAILTFQLKPSDPVTVTLRGTYAHEEVGQPPSNVIRTNSAPGRPAGSPARSTPSPAVWPGRSTSTPPPATRRRRSSAGSSNTPADRRGAPRPGCSTTSRRSASTPSGRVSAPSCCRGCSHWAGGRWRSRCPASGWC